MDLEIEDRKQYLKYLLDWCNDIYSHWETVKPRFSKQFDLRSLEEWEELYQELKENFREIEKKTLITIKKRKICMISGKYYVRNHMLFKKKLND